MANYVLGINPIVLKWARERAGYSLEDVAHAINKDADDIKLWESGNAIPTYNQLEKLAYSLYKRPLALFFFPEPPEEPEPRQSFRTLPDFEIEGFSPDTLHAVRQAQAIQISLAELTDGVNPSSKKIFKDISLNHQAEITSIIQELRSYIGISLDDQVSWRNTSIALDVWREAIQDNGIFVFKRAFKQDDISGFCLSHDEFPVIYLNNSTTKTRQIFSLFHELTHILLNISGVTLRSDSYINSLSGDSKAIEVFCNRLPSEYLVPSEDFEKHFSHDTPLDTQVEDLALHYKVSREVILRKLLDRQIIDSWYYESRITQWHKDFIDWKESRKAGGDYYATQAQYLGGKYLHLVFGKYYEGSISIEQVADYFNMKVASVSRLQDFVLVE